MDEDDVVAGADGDADELEVDGSYDGVVVDEDDPSPLHWDLQRAISVHHHPQSPVGPLASVEIHFWLC